MKNEIKVELKSLNKEVCCGELKWGTYKRLKNRVMEILSKDLATALASVDLNSLSANSGAASANLAGLAESIADAVNSINDQFIQGCLTADSGEIALDDLSLSEISDLYAAALEVNPIAEILEREKNSPSGQLVTQLAETLMSPSSRKTGGPDAGGSGSSPSLGELTDGAYDPSTKSPT